METDWGTARHPAELLRARFVVEAAAAPSVTVHVLAWLEVRVLGEQLMALSVGCEITFTTPPVAVTAMASPAGVAPKPLLAPIVTVLTPTAGVTETVATIPSAMGVAFIP
jgi:hypothetical protein